MCWLFIRRHLPQSVYIWSRLENKWLIYVGFAALCTSRYYGDERERVTGTGRFGVKTRCKEILCYSKIGLLASYLNYLPAPRLASKAAVSRDCSLGFFFKRDRKNSVWCLQVETPKWSVPQPHVHQTQIYYDEGEKRGDKASYHAPASRFFLLSWTAHAQPKTSQLLAARLAHLALLTWSTWGWFVARLAVRCRSALPMQLDLA